MSDSDIRVVSVPDDNSLSDDAKRTSLPNSPFSSTCAECSCDIRHCECNTCPECGSPCADDHTCSEAVFCPDCQSRFTEYGCLCPLPSPTHPNAYDTGSVEPLTTNCLAGCNTSSLTSAQKHLSHLRKAHKEYVLTDTQATQLDAARCDTCQKYYKSGSLVAHAKTHLVQIAPQKQHTNQDKKHSSSSPWLFGMPTDDYDNAGWFYIPFLRVALGADRFGGMTEFTSGSRWQRWMLRYRYNLIERGITIDDVKFDTLGAIDVSQQNDLMNFEGEQTKEMQGIAGEIQDWISYLSETYDFNEQTNSAMHDSFSLGSPNLSQVQPPALTPPNNHPAISGQPNAFRLAA